MWSTVNGDVMRSGGEIGSGGVAWPFSTAIPSEPRESGDDEDILGLIKSSLDRFNAQLHHSPQADLLIPASSHHANCTSSPSNDDDDDDEIPFSISHSMTPAWKFFDGVASTANFQQHSRVGQGAPGSLIQPALSVAPSTSPVGPFSGSAGIASPVFHQAGITGLIQRQQHHKQTSNTLKPFCLEEHLGRKQRSLSQTFSDSDEISFSWDSHHKALPSKVGVLSVDSGIDGETFLPPSWFVTTSSSSSNSTVDCGHFTSIANFSPIEVFSPQSVAANRSFDFPNPTQFDAAYKQVAAASVAGDTSKGGQSDVRPATALNPLFWPPSWPNTADCSPSTENPLLGDNHRHQLSALTPSFETALRQHQQQQQQSRRVCNRRKAESICLSSTMRLNSPLLQCINTLKSRSQAVNIGQLGSPVSSSLAVDLCHPLSKSYANKPQKVVTDLQQQRIVRTCTKTGNGVLGAPRMVGLRGGGSCRSKRTEATSSSSSTSSSESSSDKPVVANWRRACSFYLRGHCKKEDCEFAHDLTKVTCKFWETNECFKGPTCPFLHGYPPELLLEVQEGQERQQLQQKAEQIAGK